MAPSYQDKMLRLLARQHWLRGRDRILRAFSHPDRQQPHPFETGFYHLSYSGNKTNFIDWTVFYYGAYAPHELDLLATLARAIRATGRPVNFFDVGANIGHHTLFMSRHADQVFSFEPFASVRTEMTRKLKHAAVKNVTVFPVAFGDLNENGTFTPPTGANQGTGTLGSLLPDNASIGTISVQVVRGDDFLAANGLPAISLLKMDVEGYEAKALAGLRETLLRDRPPILLEIQPQPAGSRATRVQDFLYPDHLLFNVSHSRGRHLLRSFSAKSHEEALVIPREMAGIIPGTELR